MNGQTLLAVVLLVVGGLTLAYGGFSYTKETHTANIGTLQLSVDEEQRVNLPIWFGIGSLVLGGALLLVRRKG